MFRLETVILCHFVIQNLLPEHLCLLIYRHLKVQKGTCSPKFHVTKNTFVFCYMKVITSGEGSWSHCICFDTFGVLYYMHVLNKEKS